MPLIKGTIRGSDAASGILQLNSTSNATKGKIRLGTQFTFDELNGRVGLNNDTPAQTLDIAGNGLISGTLGVAGAVTGGIYVKPFFRTNADVTFANTAALAARTGMVTTTMAAGRKYEVRGAIYYSTPAAAGIKFAFVGPANYGCDLTAFGLGLSATTNTNAFIAAMVNASPSAATFGGAGAGVKVTCFFHGHLYSGNGGTITLQAAQNVANAGNTVIYTNSMLILDPFD